MGRQPTYDELIVRLELLERRQEELSAERDKLAKEKEEMDLRVKILEKKYYECCSQKDSLLVEKNEFIALFESIDAGIYAIDPETNEILFANNKTRKALGLKNIVGLKCYRVLQGLDNPCSFCNHPQLFGENLGKAHIFELQNNLNGKWYHCIAKAINWPGRRKMVRWEMAICIHDQKMVMEALTESETKYSTLVEHASDGITIVQDGLRQYSNKAMMEMLGYRQDELVGHPYIDIVSDEYKDQFRDLSALTHNDSGKSKLYESVLIPKSGGKLEVEISFTEIIYKNRPAHMGLIRDVSERKRMEESLRQSEQRYGALLDYLNSHIPLHVGASDEDYIFIFWNKYSEKMLGYTAEEVEGKMSPAFIHETDEEVHEVLRITGKGDIYDKEINFVHKNGTLVPVHCVVVPMRDANGELVGLYGFAEDITLRKQAEIALKESEKRFRSLVEYSPVCISIVQDGEITYENPEHKKVFAFERENKSLTDFIKRIHTDDLKRIKPLSRENFNEADPILDMKIRFYMQSRKMKRGLRWLQTHASPIEYQGREAVLFNTLDITEAKQMQHLLDMEDKMTSLGRVAAGIAHEIRSPLMAVTLFLNNLDLICRDNERVEGEFLEEAREIIGEALDALRNIESVVKRVIDFSKPSGVSRAPSSINRPIEEAVKLSAATIRKNDIKLEKMLSAESRAFCLDRHRMKQVFLNLITNSIQAMRDMTGAKILRIESEVESNAIVYRISDSGHGVPSDDWEKIFDPFFTTKANGSGIGLSISHRIVTDHNGTLTVSQSKWNGAQFTIRIPIDELG